MFHSFHLPDWRVGGGVYVLYSDRNVIYVGHTGNFRVRLLHHRRRWMFTHAKLAFISSRTERQALERILLYRLRPKNNHVVPKVYRPKGYIYGLIGAR